MKSYTQELIDELEAAGLIVKNGKMRFDSKGVLQPAYVVAPQYVKDLEAAEKVLDRIYGRYPREIEPTPACGWPSSKQGSTDA